MPRNPMVLLRRVVLLAAAGASMLAAPGAWAQAAATVTDLQGRASARSEVGAVRDLRVGSELFRGDEVQTAARSSITMEFTDGTEFGLGPEATFEISDYEYRGDAEGDRFTTRVLKGAFRFLTGLMARTRPRSMSVGMSVGTIGIRGTNVVGEVTETSATVILQEPEEDRPTAIEVFNQFGSVTIDEPGFGTDIPDANSPPSPPRRMQANTINRLNRSIQTIRRVITPRIRRP